MVSWVLNIIIIVLFLGFFSFLVFKFYFWRKNKNLDYLLEKDLEMEMLEEIKDIETNIDKNTESVFSESSNDIIKNSLMKRVRNFLRKCGSFFTDSFKKIFHQKNILTKSSQLLEQYKLKFKNKFFSNEEGIVLKKQMFVHDIVKQNITRESIMAKNKYMIENVKITKIIVENLEE